VSLDVVLTSPLVRSRQTADVVAAGFDPPPQVVTVEGLAPGGAYQAVLADLEKYPRKARIALVGHEPSLGEFAARLIGTRHPLAFKKGAICRIDVQALPPAGPGSLRWFLTPKLLKQLKK
jgi:phosphohistidine phosphatase